jgi:hypothetical protein
MSYLHRPGSKRCFPDVIVDLAQNYGDRTRTKGDLTMAEPANLPLADTTEMAGVHRVFRNALADAPQLIGSVVDDADRAEVVASYFDNVLALLAGHHDGEDELLTPRVIARATPEEAAEAERISSQHADVLGDIEAAQARIAAFRADPTTDAGAHLASALATLNADLVPHLDEEEEIAMPIAAKYINVAEWGELPSHGMSTFTGDKLWLIIGLIREQMTPRQIADMDAHMPPPVADFWANTGQQLFTDYVGVLRV